MLEELFPVVVLLFVLDCLVYVRHYQLLFVSHFPNRFTLKNPGLRLVGLWPLDEAVVAAAPPVCLTRTGVAVLPGGLGDGGLPDGAAEARFIAYEDVRDVAADGREVRINREVFFAGPCARSAGILVEHIRRLQRVEPARRTDDIRAMLADAMDLQGLNALRREHARPLLTMRVCAAALFAHLFILLPLALYSRLYVHFNIPLLILSMTATYLVTVLVTVFALRRMPGGDEAPGAHILGSIVFFPPAAAHVPQAVTRNLYARYDALTLAAALLPATPFTRLAAGELHRIAHGRDRAADPALGEFWRLKEEAVYGLLAQAGIAARDLTALPEKQDQSAAGYCPVCRTEYRAGFNTCHDCGLGLKAFE